MDKEGIELITEWPVKATHSEDEDAQSVNSPDPVQQQCRDSSSHTNSCSHKRQNSGKGIGNSSTLSVRDRLQTSYHEKDFSPMVLKRPKLQYAETDFRKNSSWNLNNSDEGRGMQETETLPGHACLNSKISAVEDNLSGCSYPLILSKSKSVNISDSENVIGSKEKNSAAVVDDRIRCPALLAQPRIARWWRRQGQHLVHFEHKKNTLGLPITTNPNTLLHHVARLPEGQSFLKDERLKLKKQIDRGECSADVMAALGSVEEWLGNPDEAVLWLKQALGIEPDNKEWQWLLRKVQRQQKVKQRQAELMSDLSLHPVFPEPQQVERVSCKELSFSDFFHQYALRCKPVIITDMVETMTAVPWDLQHIRDIAGSCEARVKRSVPGSVEWAGLEESQTVTVSQFLNNLQQGCPDYLFDWSLPLHCPRLSEELIIPRYFAGDFLQRSVPGSLYRDSWPSLFIGTSGVHSGLHVDAFASNFWMALFQGRKRWVFFQPDDLPCLYPVYAHSLDPTFEAKITDPDLEAHPLLSLVHPVECILNAGELLFVPGGSPHYVENLDTTLAISANFVDLSNFTKVLDELEVNALLDPRAADLVQQFQHPSFFSAMKSDRRDLCWADFKTWPPTDLNSYDLT